MKKKVLGMLLAVVVTLTSVDVTSFAQVVNDLVPEVNTEQEETEQFEETVMIPATKIEETEQFEETVMIPATKIEETVEPEGVQEAVETEEKTSENLLENNECQEEKTVAETFSMRNVSEHDSLIKVGDYMVLGKYNGQPIVWRCVDIDENGPLMFSDKILCLKPFDAAGSNSSSSHARGNYSYHKRNNRGSSYWADSNIRDWLNSTAKAGEVIYSDGIPPVNSAVYNGYDDYADESGFLSEDNFSEKEVSMMKTVTQKFVLNKVDVELADGGTTGHEEGLEITNFLLNYDSAYYKNTTDKVFLINLAQLQKIYDTFGDYYKGYITAEGAEQSERSVRAGEQRNYWLRDSMWNDFVSTHARVVGGFTAGRELDFFWGYDDNGTGVRPAFYLDTEVARFKEGDGSGERPYEISNKEETNLDEEFDSYKYRADYLMENIDALQKIKMVLNETSACEAVMDSIGSIESKLIEFWRGGMGFGYVKDPKTLVEYQLTAQDLYFAVILDLMKSTDEDNISDIYSESISFVDKWDKNIQKINKDYTYGMRISSLSESQKREIEDTVANLLKNDKEWKQTRKYNIDNMLNKLGDIVDTADTIGDVWTQIQNASILYELSIDNKVALKNIYERVQAVNGDNTYFLKALEWAIDCMDKAPMEINSKIVGRYAGEYLLDYFWGKVIKKAEEKSVAFAIAMGSYDAGSFGANILANTDEIVNKKLNCVVMCDVLEAVDYTCIYTINEYRKNPSKENAKIMLPIINMMFRAHLIEKDKGIAFCKALDGDDIIDNAGKGLGNKVLTSVFPGLSHSEIIEQLQSEKDSLNAIAQYLLVRWITQLPISYPESGLYEKYYGEIEKAKERVKNHIYTFACPVNVTIKGLSGTSYVKNDIIHAEEDVVIILDGSKKIVYLTSKDDYEIILDGTDRGLMEVTVSSYNENGSITNDKVYRGVPLTSNTSYIMKASNISEENVNILLEEDGKQEVTCVPVESHTISIVHGFIKIEGQERKAEANILGGGVAYITASDRNGYRFTGWSVNGDAVVEDIKAFNTKIVAGMNDSVIIANYEKISNTYTISALAGEGGYILVSGDSIVAENGSQQFYFISGDGYNIFDVQIDGSSVGIIDRYTFKNVVENHIIRVLFTKNTDMNISDSTISDNKHSNSGGSNVNIDKLNDNIDNEQMMNVYDCRKEQKDSIGYLIGADATISNEHTENEEHSGNESQATYKDDITHKENKKDVSVTALWILIVMIFVLSASGILLLKRKK